MTVEDADRLFEDMKNMTAGQLAALYKLTYLMMGRKFLQEYGVIDGELA